jgi:hypothetical protein
MVYSYDQRDAGYNRSVQPVEFGSLRQNMQLHEVILPQAAEVWVSSRSTLSSEWMQDFNQEVSNQI